MRQKHHLKFLIPSQFIEYNLSKPPGPYNQGGGMGVKYARVAEIGDYDRISEVDEIEPEDIVFVDWLWFCATDDKSIADQSKAFIELENRKGIYGSELCALSWPHTPLKNAVASADFITHNTEYQRNSYEIIGIYNSLFLCDPVPEKVFTPSRQKKNRLVCMGQISEAKRSEAVVEIFEGLRDSEIETCYIGGSRLWGDANIDKETGKLHRQMEDTADIFIENATQAEIGDSLTESAFYAHVSYHDVASSSMQEAMSAGNIPFGLKHPVLKERSTHQFDTPTALIETVKNYSLDSETYQSDLERTIETADQWSYAAWETQIAKILRLF